MFKIENNKHRVSEKESTESKKEKASRNTSSSIKSKRTLTSSEIPEIDSSFIEENLKKSKSGKIHSKRSFNDKLSANAGGKHQAGKQYQQKRKARSKVKKKANTSIAGVGNERSSATDKSVKAASRTKTKTKAKPSRTSKATAQRVHGKNTCKPDITQMPKPKIKLASSRKKSEDSNALLEMPKQILQPYEHIDIIEMKYRTSLKAMISSIISCLIIAIVFALSLIAFGYFPGSTVYAQSHYAKEVKMELIGPLDPLGKLVMDLEPVPETKKNQVYNPYALDSKYSAGKTNAGKISDNVPKASEGLLAPEKINDVMMSEGEVSENTSSASDKNQNKSPTPKEITDQLQKYNERKEQAMQQAISDEERKIEDDKKKEDEANAKAAQAAAYKFILEHPQNGAYKNTILISGDYIPIIVSENFCPDNKVGLWKGKGLVNDNEGSYYVGHNPGIFHNLVDENYTIGDKFVIWDANGNARCYTIQDSFYVPCGTWYDEKLRARTINSGGEVAVLQTCVNNDTQYKIMVGR